MTICVPRKPFEYFGIIIIYCGIFSWIITIPVGIISALNKWKYGDPIEELFFGVVALFIWLWWFSSENETDHWIQWCENKPTDKTSKEESK